MLPIWVSSFLFVYYYFSFLLLRYTEHDRNVVIFSCYKTSTFDSRAMQNVFIFLSPIFYKLIV
jgi:hypothetical protein